MKTFPDKHYVCVLNEGKNIKGKNHLNIPI